MRHRERPIHAFRRRLLRLIDAHFDGHYTAFARRAGIPISSMQHYVHTAKHLPGGEHLMRMAAAFGVTVQYLITGREGVWPAVRPAPPVPDVQPEGELVAPTARTIPVFRCSCPGACPLTDADPPVAAAVSMVMVPTEILPTQPDHRLLALQVGAGLASAEWPDGTRLVMDADARTPPWGALALIHTEGHCQLGHVTPVEEALIFGECIDDCRVIQDPWRILGTMVAVVAPLGGVRPPGQPG